MTFSAKIRWYLLGVAVVPPLLVLAVLVAYVNRQMEAGEEIRVAEKLQTYAQYRTAYVSELRSVVDRAIASSQFDQAMRALNSTGTVAGSLSPVPTLDFLELISGDGRVIASIDRPGMVGERITNLPLSDSTEVITSVEYDRHGTHPSFVVVSPIGKSLKVYAGRFFESGYLATLRGVIHADLALHTMTDEDTVPASISQLQLGTWSRKASSFQALLEGGATRGFHLVANLPVGEDRSAFLNVIRTTAWVTVASTLIALALGLYLSWQTKREIRNLIDATTRVARGDLSTAVMSFEEGEFAALAEAFSSMVTQLKESQGRLAASQTIAAWQTMGRKIAHEVKNPLTPIAICADDLRRSYQEKLPNFDQTLDANTRTIKNEVARLTHLLDEFSRFARMAPPQKVSVDLPKFLAELRALYARQIEAGQMVINDTTTQRFYRFDPQQIKQVVINCIKNSLEACAETIVTVVLTDHDDCLKFTIEDTGPGFAAEQLERRFEPYLSSKRDGSGLGLVICQRIVIDHGGSIDLQNLPDKGAGVRFTLPNA